MTIHTKNQTKNKHPSGFSSPISYQFKAGKSRILWIIKKIYSCSCLAIAIKPWQTVAKKTLITVIALRVILAQLTKNLLQKAIMTLIAPPLQQQAMRTHFNPLARISNSLLANIRSKPATAGHPPWGVFHIVNLMHKPWPFSDSTFFSITMSKQKKNYMIM